MEDKKQDVNKLEELVKTADSYRAFFANLADELSKVLADIKVPEKEEDTWEMKCPYECGDGHYCLQPSGDVFRDCWENIEADNKYFSQGNTFPTEQAAKLEAERRNLLTRFRAFRDECNGDWKADFKNKTAKNEAKWNISYYNGKLQAACTNTFNDFVVFGYFKKKRGALRAIELFGDEIKELFVDCEGR